jgi:FtsZ-interacting cell division protein ZipA
MMMTDDLNLILWGAGGFVILSVIFYNFWQEYKAKKNVERAFGQHQDDVLMKTGELAINISAPREDSTTQRHEPSLNEHSENIVPTANLAKENEQLPIDEFIDCVITMEFESPTRGDKILNETQSFRRVGNKPVHFIGTNTNDNGEVIREVISPATSYTHLSAGVQLVNRSGALNELEYSELVTKLRQIADNLNAHPDIPDMKYVMDSARDLHLFVSEHDAQLSVNIHTNGAPWGISTLLAALEKIGFDSRPDGRLAMLDGEGGALFTLSTNCGVSAQDTKRITLLLDVPCVIPARGGFKAMVACAKSLSTRLGGTVVDDTNAILSDETLNQIHEQVESFYRSMQEAEIPAGSTRALRIFS